VGWWWQLCQGGKQPAWVNGIYAHLRLPNGLTSSRLTKIDRCDHVSSAHVKATGRQKPTDPITHRNVEEPILDRGEVGGAAGQSSSRLTQLNSDWAEIPRGPSHTGFAPPARTNPISWPSGGDASPPVFEVPQGLCPWKFESNVPLDHTDKYLAEKLSPEEIKEKGGVARQKQVPIAGGKVLYNVAGYGDLLPAATQEYNKSELPPSRSHKIQNDKKNFPAFLHMRTPLKAGLSHPSYVNSPEMTDAMHGTYHGGS